MARTAILRAGPEIRSAVRDTLKRLDNGELRVAEPGAGGWVVNEWVKKAVLLSFKLNENSVSDSGFTRFYDKVPLKHAQHDAASFERDGARVVPGALVRYGAYVAPDVVLDAKLRQHRRVDRPRNDDRHLGIDRLLRTGR